MINAALYYTLLNYLICHWLAIAMTSFSCISITCTMPKCSLYYCYSAVLSTQICPQYCWTSFFKNQHEIYTFVMAANPPPTFLTQVIEFCYIIWSVVGTKPHNPSRIPIYSMYMHTDDSIQKYIVVMVTSANIFGHHQ